MARKKNVRAGARKTSRRLSTRVTTKKTGSKVGRKKGTRKKKTTSKKRVAKLNADDSVRTVVYVHGIGNKPPPSVLKSQWDHALFGFDMGDRTRMAYWVDRMRYPVAAGGTGAGDDHISPAAVEVSHGDVRRLSLDADDRGREWLERELDAMGATSRNRKRLVALVERVEAADKKHRRAPSARDRDAVRAKFLPLPAPLRRFVTRHVTRLFLRDVSDFLFVQKRRQEMKESLESRLDAGGGPFVVVAHSQGSMIAYDVLRRRPRASQDVALFLTIGSPLGLKEVQDELVHFRPRRSLRVPPCVRRWVNVAEFSDPVAADKRLNNDFAGKIEDIVELGLNLDLPAHPHSATGYLRAPQTRDPIREVVGTGFAQRTGRFVISRALARELEDAGKEERRPILIQLENADLGGGLDETRTRLAGEIKEIAGRRHADARIDPMQRFLSARLTRAEVERLHARHKNLKISRVWRDSLKRALISESAKTIHAQPANLGYGATGEGIHWAVLDSGIVPDHRHFAEHQNLAVQYDCTKRGAPKGGEFDHSRATSGRRTKKIEAYDGDGHGTHVAGIIAGELELPEKKGGDAVKFAGMAPEAKLHVYKVLKDNGEGRDSFIIKALDHIAETNENAGSLAIHGLNLSLGSPFDPSEYGCGHTPICQELRRLARMGVVVVVAAGNEGFAVLETEEGPFEANLDLTIGDPANLEEAISVGSVHKTSPHTYGISYFSSRGPTADGRVKPDVVAPGERIVSAAHTLPSRKATKASPHLVKDLYVELTGTSMAAPHVSGVCAAFLSVRREFIGRPDTVKRLLMENCIDLGRDPYFQGAGVPNLVKMLLNT